MLNLPHALLHATVEKYYITTYMQVICLEEEAFYALLEQVVERLRDKHSEKDKWISDEEAMQLLRIKSKTTLQQYRDQGKIRFSQPQKKLFCTTGSQSFNF